TSFKVIVKAPEGHTLDEPQYSRVVDALVLELAEVPQAPEKVAPVVVPDGASLSDAEYAAAVEQVRESAAEAEPDPEALVISNPVVTAELQDQQVSALSEAFGFDEAVAA